MEDMLNSFHIGFKKPNSSKVAKYYSVWNDRYLKDFGDIFQAFKSTNKNVLLDHYINVMRLNDGMNILDAGCGVGGCGIYFLHKKDLNVDGINISKEQVDICHKEIEAIGFENKFRVQQGDYHYLSKYYKRETFDVVYFLESLVHSNCPNQVLRECNKVIKKGGFLYIKDLFMGIPASSNEKKLIRRAVKNCNKYFSVRIIYLDTLLKLLRKNNFSLLFAREIEIESDYSDVNRLISNNEINIHQNTIHQVSGKEPRYLIFYEILAMNPNE